MRAAARVAATWNIWYLGRAAHTSSFGGMLPNTRRTTPCPSGSSPAAAKLLGRRATVRVRARVRARIGARVRARFRARAWARLRVWVEGNLLGKRTSFGSSGPVTTVRHSVAFTWLGLGLGWGQGHYGAQGDQGMPQHTVHLEPSRLDLAQLAPARTEIAAEVDLPKVG